MQEDGIKMQEDEKMESSPTCLYTVGHKDGTFILWYRSHHFSAVTVAESRDSARAVPGISSSLGSTSSKRFSPHCLCLLYMLK